MLLNVTAKLHRHPMPPCQRPPPTTPFLDISQDVLLPTFQDQFAKLATFSELAQREFSTERGEDMRRASCGLEVSSATRKARSDMLNGVKCNIADKCRLLLDEMYRVN